MRFYPDWSLSTLNEGLISTSPKHTRFRLTTNAVVYLENVTVSCLFTTFPFRSTRRQIIETRDIRKDFRRPRFSFFRFNCQTARLNQTLSERNRPVLSVLLTEELAGEYPRSSRRQNRGHTVLCAAVRWAGYRGNLGQLSTGLVKKDSFFFQSRNINRLRHLRGPKT